MIIVIEGTSARPAAMLEIPESEARYRISVHLEQTDMITMRKDIQQPNG